MPASPIGSAGVSASPVVCSGTGCIDRRKQLFRTRGRRGHQLFGLEFRKQRSRPFVGVLVSVPVMLSVRPHCEGDTRLVRNWRRQDRIGSGGAAMTITIYHIQLWHVAQHAGNDPSKWRRAEVTRISQESAIAPATAGVDHRDGHFESGICCARRERLTRSLVSVIRMVG